MSFLALFLNIDFFPMGFRILVGNFNSYESILLPLLSLWAHSSPSISFGVTYTWTLQSWCCIRARTFLEWGYHRHSFWTSSSSQPPFKGREIPSWLLVSCQETDLGTLLLQVELCFSLTPSTPECDLIWK